MISTFSLTYCQSVSRYQYSLSHIAILSHDINILSHIMPFCLTISLFILGYWVFIMCQHQLLGIIRQPVILQGLKPKTAALFYLTEVKLPNSRWYFLYIFHPRQVFSACFTPHKRHPALKAFLLYNHDSCKLVLGHRRCQSTFQ